MVSTAFAKASLKLWQRRLAYRQKRLAVARRSQDSERVKKWTSLVNIAKERVKLRKAQLLQASKPIPARGIDISNNNASFEPVKVKRAGYDFVYLKVSEGATFVDRTFRSRAAAAHDAGLEVGAYHFLRPTTGRPGRAEAAFFHQRIGEAHMDLVPVVDVEATNLTRAATEQYVQSFLDGMKKLGHERVLIYTYPYFMDWSHNHNCGLWIADYDKDPPRVPKAWHGKYLIHQFDDKHSVPGVGLCDANRCPDIRRIRA